MTRTTTTTYRPLARAVLASVMAFVLILSVSTPAVALYEQEDGDVVPEPNPDFPQKCGADVMLLIDNSASLSQRNLTDIKEAANSTVDSLRTSEDVSSVGLITFNSFADTRVNLTNLDSDSDSQRVKEKIGNITLVEAETGTNWEDAFLEASKSENDDASENVNKPADLIIIISDGRPTVYGETQTKGDDSSTSFNEPLEAATAAANVTKDEGSRVIGIGFPGDDGNPSPAAPFRNITNGSNTGDASISNTESNDLQEIDYYLFGDSEAIDPALSGIAQQFDCGVSVEKTNDANLNGNFTDNRTEDEVAAPGADVPFRVTVENTGNVSVNISDFSDTKYGSDFPVNCDGTDINTSEKGVPAGGTVTCEFSQSAPNADDVVHNNTFTVTASDDNGFSLSDDDWTEFRTEDLQPGISVVKEVDANGDGQFADNEEANVSQSDPYTYRINATNTGEDSLNVTDIDDSVTDLAGSDCESTLNGTEIAPGDYVECTFDSSSQLQDDNDSVTNEFTVEGADDDGNMVSDSDTATVTTPDLDPGLAVEKLVDADRDGTFADSETAEPNQADRYNYSITVTNDGDDTVIISNIDDSETALAGTECESALNGTAIAPGDSVTCEFLGDSEDILDDNQSLTNEFIVEGADDDGNPVFDSDTATVTTPNELPIISVNKTVDADRDGEFADTDQAEPNQDDRYNYSITITNDGQDTLNITDVMDNETTDPLGDCENLVGVSVPAGESVSCEFLGDEDDILDDNQMLTNEFTVSGEDDEGNTVADASDTATVTTPNELPTISVTKLVDADRNGTFADTEEATPGQSQPYNYSITVSNTGNDTLVLTGIDDNETSDLGECETALNGTVIAPGDSVSCEFLGDSEDILGDNASLTNEFTVSGEDDEGNTVADASDTARVYTEDIQPAISVVKSNDANENGTFTDTETADVPGKNVTYAVTVSNIGDENVTLDSYDDSVYNISASDLNRSLAGVELAPGQSVTVAFNGTAPADDASSKTNVFTVNASDDDNNEIDASDDSTVESRDILPALTVDKTNDANEDGTFTDTETATETGANVTFRVNITNDASENATITDISDDIHDVNTSASGYDGCEALFGTTLEPGQTAACYFNGTVTDETGTSETDTVTANVSDDDGNNESASDTSTVTTAEGVRICPRTPGFWSTHNADGPASPDLVSDDLPLWLGDAGGEDSVRVANASAIDVGNKTDNNATSQQVFDYDVTEDSSASNGISKLQFHLLAAKLNVEHGAAVPQNVSTTIEDADAFLANNSEADWDDLNESQQQMVLDWKDTLDAYNNGHYTSDDCVQDWWKDDTESGDSGGASDSGNGPEASSNAPAGPDENPGEGDERADEPEDEPEDEAEEE